jgi:hypothetical protein
MFKVALRVVSTVLRVWWWVAVGLCVLVFGMLFLQLSIGRRTLRAVGC